MLNTALLCQHTPLGIALSGGSDSSALLTLAVDALGAENLRAVTVNHGLRDEAALEALAAKQLCAQLGVAHDTLDLHVAAGSGLQARARGARYDALCAWARESGVSALALGHTQDDVAETFMMRLARGSGVDGLAQMPARFEREGTLFLRPLLDATRSDLQSMLRGRGIDWSTDPSNADPRFARVLARNAAPELAALGLTQERLSQSAKWMRAACEVLEHAADAWIARHAQGAHGDAVFDLAELRRCPEETAGRVLTRALCAISGKPYRPRYNALAEMMETYAGRTLHGCLIYRHKATLRITRELNAMTPGDTKRWVISGPLTANHTIAPLTEVGLSQITDWRATALLPRRSLLASPAIWQGRSLVAAPLAAPDGTWSAAAPNPLHLAK